VFVILALSKMAALPNEILVPETVATMAVPYLLLPQSEYAITVLFALGSYIAAISLTCAFSNSAELPKLMFVPLTVPTIA